MALPNATWNGQQIVTIVSRNTGLANNSTARSAVTDYVNMALFEINGETAWDWLAVTNASITVSAGSSDYNLPTASGSVYDDIYDVRLTSGNERTLDPLSRRTYDRYRRRYQSTQSPPTHYLIYGAQQNAVITLVPTPNAADALTLRYFIRQGTISDATGSSLAMADRYVPVVLYKACALTSMWKDPERAPFWEAQYRRALARALDRDRVLADETPQLTPQAEHAAQRIDYVNPTDLDFYPR